jgi:hypothetical protein
METDIAIEKSFSNEVQAPLKSTAFISLSDGRNISLDSFGIGTMAMQGDVSIVKSQDGQVLYKGNSTEEQFNVLFNPRGSKAVTLTLNDGSTVWLNSESSIKYPTAFMLSERKVEITGEAYFEVAKNPSKPFKVAIKKMSGTVAEIEVLGTSFNVNGFEDEKTINTTLLEGRVRLIANQFNGNKETAEELLSPGQQAQLNTNGTIRVYSNTNIEEVISWKNGLFQFESADIKTILRQLARWYDIEISFEKEPSNRKYFMIINRDNTLSEVLKVLKASDIKFSIVGNKLIVY